jgi:4-alpha-glucanotransferase
MTRDLDKRAAAAGIAPGYHDIDGTWHVTSPETKAALLDAMGGVPDNNVDLHGTQAPVLTCLTPAERGLGRTWGVAAQTYGLKSRRNAGIGDFADIRHLAELAAGQGADVLGLSPLHARFRDQPERACPYAPSSRRWLDPFAIAVDEAAAELGIELPELPAADGGELIDYAAMARAKEAAFAALAEGFGPAHPAYGDYRQWCETQGPALESFARFEAIALTLRRQLGEPVGWRDWPAELRHVQHPGVEAFAAAHRPLVEESRFLQWLARRQLEATQARALAAGMRIGLYADIAVGVVPDGADVWADPADVVAGASIGAPPDPFSPTGQNWNVAPLSPMALLSRDFAPLRALLDAAMAPAGAVRIDHAMGLMRLFWIPSGGTPADGAYVSYPLPGMLRTVAAASRAHDCLVIGEDLGTVAPGFREAMMGAGLLSYRVVWFERWESGLFRASDSYPEAALATVSTHDLATVRGFLLGRDIDWRLEVGQLDAAKAAEARRSRTAEIRRLKDALAHEGLLDGDDPEGLAVALHRFLARTPAALAMVQVEDLEGALEQPNLPGTIDEHPNWRRRMQGPLAGLLSSPLAGRLVAAMAAERGHGS